MDNHVRLLQIWEEMKNTIDKEPIGE